jgi:hypothetical protein
MIDYVITIQNQFNRDLPPSSEGEGTRGHLSAPAGPLPRRYQRSSLILTREYCSNTLGSLVFSFYSRNLAGCMSRMSLAWPASGTTPQRFPLEDKYGGYGIISARIRGVSIGDLMTLQVRIPIQPDIQTLIRYPVFLMVVEIWRASGIRKTCLTRELRPPAQDD